MSCRLLRWDVCARHWTLSRVPVGSRDAAPGMGWGGGRELVWMDGWLDLPMAARFTSASRVRTLVEGGGRRAKTHATMAPSLVGS